VEVGETRVLVELFDLAMTRAGRVEYFLAPDARGPDAVVDRLLQGLSVVLAEAGVDPARVLGLGVAVDGVVEGRADAVVHGRAPGWDAVPLGAMLAAGTAVPIEVDNAANALGQAEMWFGAGRGATDAVVALIGSGVGAALVAGGVGHPGARRRAGEWGHTTIRYGGRRCRCGAEGCLEAYVGARAVLERFAAADDGRPALGEDEESAFLALLDSVPSSEVAAEIVEETVGYLGAGLATVVNLLNPERSCWAAGPASCWASGSCRSCGRPPRGMRCGSRSPRSRSSCASSAGTRSRWAPRSCPSSGCCARAVPSGGSRPAGSPAAADRSVSRTRR
jgi:predicted NBD/HSP70 family sugar kinase